ncbi:MULTISPECIES: glutamate--cysteine ligase [unclassified Acinetobacter]|uniref:glutamate--cysteine ligase n=1 Tax=unclassified Acinetobacter TaxID=196816 RepID=UPI0035BB55EF
MQNTSSMQQHLSLPAHLLKGMQRGLERETLRMQGNGFLSQKPHPQGLGSALTHSYITTDYSEALLELITPPKSSIPEALDFLTALHQFVDTQLAEDEQLWPLSMPCMLDSKDENIPLANYGSSNLGKFKTLYRHGLGIRYGRRMQTIAGIHYNLSFPEQLFDYLQQQENDENLRKLTAQDYRSMRYFGLIRNFIRHLPLVMYVLGASPTVCRCFVSGRPHHLHQLNQTTLYLPHATALRMGKLGYQNSAQRALGIHYNNLPDYVKGIRAAIHTPFEPFQQLGLDDENGEPIQINDHVLQIENEYYSLIRPKQPPQGNETPAQALAARGVAYVELRAVDINPYLAIGIDEQSAAFLETLALYCLLQDSPMISDAEQTMLDDNQNKVVDFGRDADCRIQTPQGEVLLKDWLQDCLQNMLPYAELLNQAHTVDYRSAVQLMQQRVACPEQTLSARMLAETQQAGGTWHFGAELAKQHQAYIQNYVMSDELKQFFAQAVEKSIVKQTELEASDDMSFKQYVQQYR